MKNVFVLLFCAGLAQSGALAQYHVDYIATDELAQSVKVPSQVLELVARPKSQKPTWAILEMNGEPTEVYGQLREVSRSQKTTTYVVGMDTVALPNKDYQMKKGILYNSRSQKLECVILELKSCMCTAKTGIIFTKDSVTTNTHPEAYKMIFSTTTDHLWVYDENMLVPAVPSYIVDSLDENPVADYALAVITEDGAICDLLWLHRDELVGQTKQFVYIVDKREGKRFAVTVEGGHTFDGRPVNGVMVLTPYTPPKGSGKSLNRKHKKKKRTKI